ncbi:MAG: hypothetical protein LBS96_00585 [Oscillospiraceae bacterium]|jgi:serpin B|nr:hypothetical protein [Oscillospiraceae bacterium]
MKLRKTAATLLALCLVFSLAGCAGKNEVSTLGESTGAAIGAAQEAVQTGIDTTQSLADTSTTGDAGSEQSTSATSAKSTATLQTQKAAVAGQKFSSPAAGANDFAFRLTGELLKSGGKSNFICSPFSVWLPLVALANATDDANRPALLNAIGAAGFSVDQINGAAKQMLYNLTNEQSKADGVAFVYNPLQIANAIFVGNNMTLKKSFESAFAENFGGKAFSVDFASPQAVKTVNDWASKNTNGLIPSIVEQFAPQTVAAIANAIYFSDRWNWEFDQNKTKKDAFHGLGGDTKADFMLREGDALTYYEDDKLQAMPLEFKTGGGLYILLPKDGDAVSLLTGMTSDKFQKIIDGFGEKTGKLLLPRFQIDNGGTDLAVALQTLGVPLFDANAAPLTGGLINESIPLWLSGAVQKAKIEVDEKGTTAAAVTVITVFTGAGPPQPTKPFEMICNKPFAFVLYGNGGQILFTGVVNQAG